MKFIYSQFGFSVMLIVFGFVLTLMGAASKDANQTQLALPWNLVGILGCFSAMNLVFQSRRIGALENELARLRGALTS